MVVSTRPAASTPLMSALLYARCFSPTQRNIPSLVLVNIRRAIQQVQKSESPLLCGLQVCNSVLPWSKMKFVDESHFKSRDLYRNKALSPRNEPLDILPSDMNDETVTMMMTLDPAPHPVEIDLRVDSNDQFDSWNSSSISSVLASWQQGTTSLLTTLPSTLAVTHSPPFAGSLHSRV